MLLVSVYRCIGVSERSLRRFISGKTHKLGDENIIRIARVFHISADFLLGEAKFQVI